MRGSRYNESDRETAMKAVVLAEDNVAKAARDLQAAGFDIPRSTLREWIARDPERLEAIRIQYGPELEEKKARMAEKVATAAGEATLALVEQTMETKDDLSAKDVAGAARNMATVFGIATEKGLLHRQKPTSITAHDYSSAVKGLERMGLIEGTAEEIPDASSTHPHMRVHREASDTSSQIPSEAQALGHRERRHSLLGDSERT